MTLAEYIVNNTQLQKEWAYDKNAVSPGNITPRSRIKTWWRCEKGHEWQATPDSRVSLGRNCPICANQTVLSGENDAATVVPQMAKLWHPTLNGELKLSDITAGSSKKLWWRCEKGHEWQAYAYRIKAGDTCPYCSGRCAIPGETDLATTHPDVLKRWSSKNKVLPSEITARSHKKVW